MEIEANLNCIRAETVLESYLIIVGLFIRLDHLHEHDKITHDKVMLMFINKRYGNIIYY